MNNEMNDVYDELYANEKIKNGTKYEKLTAIVFKTLNSGDTVIHDLKLRGIGKKAKHQIDVTIEKKETGSKKRILIECKDYDKVVGIKIIRDFFGAVSQIKPDEAFVVTTKGYTKGAKDFADDENIKLLILKPSEEEDLENRIKEIHLQIDVINMGIPRITKWKPANEVEASKYETLIETYKQKKLKIQADEHFFYNQKGTEINTFQQILTPIFNNFPRNIEKKTTGTHIFPEIYYIKLFDILIGIEGFEYEFESYAETFKYVIDQGTKIAKLILKSLDESLNEMIFDQDLKKWTFDSDGEVIENQ